jgi:hypothetical protein
MNEVWLKEAVETFNGKLAARRKAANAQVATQNRRVEALNVMWSDVVNDLRSVAKGLETSLEADCTVTLPDSTTVTVTVEHGDFRRDGNISLSSDPEGIVWTVDLDDHLYPFSGDRLIKNGKAIPHRDIPRAFLETLLSVD